MPESFFFSACFGLFSATLGEGDGEGDGDGDGSAVGDGLALTLTFVAAPGSPDLVAKRVIPTISATAMKTSSTAMALVSFEFRPSGTFTRGKTW